MISHSKRDQIHCTLCYLVLVESVHHKVSNMKYVIGISLYHN